MKKAIYLLSFFMFPFCLFSQTGGEIKGKILDSLTHEPLFNALVWVESGGSMQSTLTDTAGKFTIKPLPGGFYDLNVSYLGKKKYILYGVRVNSSQISVLNPISLVDNTLKTVEIKTEKYTDTERLIKPDNPGEMTILPADLKSNPLNKMIKEMIAKTIPGVYQADDGQPLYFRGSRNDAVQYYVDGVKSRNGNIGIPNCAIGSINVYTGGVPAMYGDLTGGVVVIETKSFFQIYHQSKNQ